MFASAPIRRRNANVCVVAAEQHVLAVVDELAGVAVGERGRASAELRPRVEHEHALARLGQHGRRAQAGKAGADDDDVRGCRHRPASVLEPGGRRDQRAARPRDADDRREHVVVARSMRSRIAR